MSPVSLSNPASAAARPAFRDSRWRPFLCCAGALGVGISLAPLVLKPASAPAAGESASAPEIALDREDTSIVTSALPPGELLRGRLALVAGETDALGRARAGGQVARHLVENGARVQRGDAVVEISSGAARRTAPVAESSQNRAEQSQIAAADAQNALAQKISIAQTRLRAAQERVASAQSQVGVARDVVRRLQNGQSVAPGEIPAPLRGPNRAAARTTRRARIQSATPRPNRETQIAARQAEAAREAAQESLRAVQTARDTLADAQNAARQAEEKRQSSAKSVAEVEARFDDQKASGADVEAARGAQKEAQSAASSAEKTLIAAQSDLAKREKNAASAQSYAQSSAEQAAKALASARLQNPGAENSAESEPIVANADAASGAPRVTLSRAIQFAGEALEESRRASRDAERIHTEIEGYQSQVARSNSRIQAATEDLANAQQRVMDSVPRPRFTTSYAPASGIITWISRLAREVGVGDPVFGVASRQRVAARFEDKSGLWRAIKPGATLAAFVIDAPAPPATKNEGSGQETSNEAATSPEALAKLGAARAIELKMTEVQAPQIEGEAARISGALVSTKNEESLAEGAQVLVSMPRPGQKATLSVPASALLQRGENRFVAVLAPISPQKTADEVFGLQWTRVETGRSDGLRLEIVAGLRAGARVVSEPEDLEAMGFAPESAPTSTVFDKKNATADTDPASNPAPVPGVSNSSVVVRLTAALT